MRRLYLTDRQRVMLWCILLGLQPAFGGILDPFNWARSDRIEVNIPWLPCEYLLKFITKQLVVTQYSISNSNTKKYTQLFIFLLLWKWLKIEKETYLILNFNLNVFHELWVQISLRLKIYMFSSFFNYLIQVYHYIPFDYSWKRN